MIILADFNEPFAGYIRLEQEPRSFLESATALRDEIQGLDPAINAEAIDFKTYLPLMLGMRDSEADEELMSAFRAFDLAGRGAISRDEFGQVLANLGLDLSAKQVDSLFRDLDADSNGEIDYSEFVKLVVAK